MGMRATTGRRPKPGWKAGSRAAWMAASMIASMLVAPAAGAAPSLVFGSYTVSGPARASVPAADDFAPFDDDGGRRTLLSVRIDYDATLAFTANFDFNGFSEPMDWRITLPHHFEWYPQRDGGAAPLNFGSGDIRPVLDYVVPELSTLSRTDKLVLHGSYTESDFDFGAPFSVVATVVPTGLSADATVRGVFLGGGVASPTFELAELSSLATLTFAYVTSVPEPGTAALAVLGLAAVGAAARRRRG